MSVQWARLEGVRAFYRTGEEVRLATLPAGTSRVVARRARGGPVEAEVGTAATFAGLPGGTYSIEALGADGSMLAEELTTVGVHAGERPVHGFATSFEDKDTAGVLEWLKELRCTVVQIYDWMSEYTAPLGPEDGWRDPSGRPVSFLALRALAAGIREQGAVAHAYAPVYAADPHFATEHPEMMLYQGDGPMERFFDMIKIANPADKQWQDHFAASYGSAADRIGFDGFHIDTYGYPRSPLDASGQPVDLRAAYEEFLMSFRAARPADQVSFNQVNGVPSAVTLPEGPGFRYCEVWAPNDGWRHLEGLMDRSAGRAGLLGPGLSGGPLMRGSIACYPPVWGTNDPDGPVSGPARESSLRTVVCTEAVATCLGSSALLFGDVRAVLCDPYYPKHERLSEAEVATVLAWHRFALRYRDLFLEGEDTSWYDVGDDNGAVSLHWDGPVRPEPAGGTVFARVVRTDDCIAVGVVDLTGSVNGSWSEPTAVGRCQSVRVRALLDEPESWKADVAVLGRAGDRFTTVPFSVVEHREGRAAQLEVPLGSGWSVLRMTR
ncbi:MAG: glycoside hydrolase family 66 protein [Acidimicrobiales bacterium]|jgi:dextranase